MHVLIGAADLQLATLLIRGLRSAGIRADVAGSGEEATSMAAAGSYDALVIDDALPDQTGHDACHDLRARAIWTPVVVLTSGDAGAVRLHGRPAAADAYVAKPFAVGELLSRLRVVGGDPDGAREPLVAGDLVVDPVGRSARRGDTVIDLSMKEFALLEALVRRAGEVVTRDELLEHAWDYDFEHRSNIVDVYVGYLREKVDRRFDVHAIETVRGAGYRLRADGGASTG
ncbi:MAG: response regulator transcription factor [Patulibacter sp.]|nr:response regulator transcription factor [Patulibacter sp.]